VTDGEVTVSLNGNKLDWELGGRHHNVVLWSDNPHVGKGWRLLKLNGTDVGSDIVNLLGAARRKGRYTATFFGGKAAGGGGMNFAALAKATKAVVTSPPMQPRLAQSKREPPDVNSVTSTTSIRSMLPEEYARLKHEFISFDSDRDGEHSLHDFIAMLKKLNEEYEFMEDEGAAAYARKQWAAAGGRRADPDDEDDEGSNVSLDGFCAWYRPFVEQCEQKKRDEYAVTKDLSGAQFEAYMAARTLEARNRAYHLLHAPAG